MSMDLFNIDSALGTPKFRQMIDGIMNAIERKDIVRGESLPSVSQICKQFSLSRDTVVKAYNELKRQGIVEAIPRKGYYVASEYIKHTNRVFLMIDAFTPYKQVLFNAFKDDLGDDAIIDIYFHHCNIELFESLILDNMGKYSVYIVTAFAHSYMPKVFAKLDSEKFLAPNGNSTHLLIVDRERAYFDNYSYICQDFTTALYDSLQSGLSLFKKYNKLVLVFPMPGNHPKEIMDTFGRFCRDINMDHKIIHDLKMDTIKQGNAYFVLDDFDLVYIVEQCKLSKYTLGEDIGVVSYNDTAMKRIAGNGITVISTDFADLGRKAALWVRNPKKVQEIVPTELIVRSSL
jgi:DNA-binding transcriptional regulator YhcF (GntR family)